jgi:curved DNA-binding protein CbpA
MPSYYEILGLGPDASPDEIEQAFRTMARKVHPDVNDGDRARAEARMKQLNDIRETLTDPLLRAAYDADLRRAADERRARAESGPAGEYVRVSTPFSVAAPAGGLGPRRAPLVRILAGLALLGLTTAAVVFAPWRSPRWASLFGGRPQPEAAAEPPAPAAPQPHPKHAGAPPPSTTVVKMGHKGVVKIGSTAAEVLRVMGPPDRTEPGALPGTVVYRYGQLRLELRDGAVVGGGL